MHNNNREFQPFGMLFILLIFCLSSVLTLSPAFFIQHQRNSIFCYLKHLFVSFYICLIKNNRLHVLHAASGSTCCVFANENNKSIYFGNSFIYFLFIFFSSNHQNTMVWLVTILTKFFFLSMNSFSYTIFSRYFPFFDDSVWMWIAIVCACRTRKICVI